MTGTKQKHIVEYSAAPQPNLSSAYKQNTFHVIKKNKRNVSNIFSLDLDVFDIQSTESEIRVERLRQARGRENGSERGRL